MTYSSQRKIQKVHAYLVKEILDEMPVFYKGYKAVLRKEKTLEDIMGASGLQIYSRGLVSPLDILAKVTYVRGYE
jgi:hypothetical protein